MGEDIKNPDMGISPEEVRKIMIDTLDILSGDKEDDDGRTWISEVPDTRKHGSDKDSETKSKVLAAWSGGIIGIFETAKSINLFPAEQLKTLEERIKSFSESVDQVRRLVNVEADKRDMAERELETEWRPRDQAEEEAKIIEGSAVEGKRPIKIEVKITDEIRAKTTANIKEGDALIQKMKEILNPNENSS